MGRALIPEERLAFDDDGFLRNPGEWDEDLAVQLALEDGFENLTEAHWQVISYLREHYLAHGTLPPAGYLGWVFKMQRKEVLGLFHGMRGAWRIAGLPNPGEEAKAYM